MATNTRTGLEFIEGFTLLVGAMWLLGALLVGGLVLMGQGRVAGTPNDSNQTAVGEMPTQ
ncbi:hypothetical protein ACFSX5_05885 [Devosia albogilva]|uniref:Uncharacterized protein n=1 Tax=Devosia albogilva TaxID=429726 RepID=A0ABW5QHU9_9HYPH